MGDGVIAGGRVGLQGDDPEPADRVMDIELAELDLDPEGSEGDPFQTDRVGDHRQDAGSQFQAAVIKLVKELAQFVMNQPQTRRMRGRGDGGPLAVAQSVLQLAQAGSDLPANLV